MTFFAPWQLHVDYSLLLLDVIQLDFWLQFWFLFLSIFLVYASNMFITLGEGGVCYTAVFSVLTTNGYWKPNHIPFPLCLRSNEQTNQISRNWLWRQFLRVKPSDSGREDMNMLSSKSWTAEPLRKLSTVIRNALLALRRQKMQRKFTFLVKVQSTCKVLLNRPLMWMWAVSRTVARYLFARVATNDWRSFSDLLKNWTKFAKKLKKPSKKGMYREQSAFKGLQKNYTPTFLKETIRTRSAICRGHRKV